MNNSPFELFRRNLKPLMVFLTALALFAFVVLPVLDSYMRQNVGAAGEDVVATYDGTSLTRGRVDYFTRNHQSTVRFLLQLAEETMARGGREVGFVVNQQTNQVEQVGINQNPGFETSIRTLMLATQANKAGFELDDSSLQVWLERYTDGMVSNADINAMLMQSTQNQMGRPHLYEQLRSHLLAGLYLNRGYAGLYMGDSPMAPPLMTPQEQWLSFLKLNRNAVIDSYGVLVNDYIDKTNPSPSDAEIQAVYDEGKDRDPIDQSPEPAFHRRYSATFEYLVGDLQKFLDEEIAKLSEEEIRAEYERRLKGGEFQLPETGEEATGEEATSEATESDSGEEATEAASESESTEKASGEETEPAAEAATEDSATDSAAPAEETDPAGSAEDDATTESPQPEDQSRAVADSAVRLVVLQEQAAEQNEAETNTETPTQDDAAKVEEAKASETAADDPAPPDDTKTEAPPQDAPAEDEAATEDTAEDESAAADPKPADESEQKPDDQPKVESFEDVRQAIAEDMAGPAARARLERAIADVASQMRLYFNKQAIHESNLLIGQGGEPPVKPDLKQLATDLGLQYEIIGPYSEVSITDEPIANSSQISTQFGGRGPSFSVMMYGFDNGQTQLPRQQPFSPVRTADAPAGKQYVSWKIAETEAYTPSLAEVREEVVMAIRVKEARELARDAAEAIAEQANASDKPLEEIVPEDKRDNVKTGLGPFSWMESFGFAGATIGNIPELDSVGDEFMRTVFQKEVGQYGVAMNQSGRVLYVVKPTKFEPSIDELREQFKQPTNRMMAMLIGNDAAPILTGFYDAIDEQASFTTYTDPEE